MKDKIQKSLWDIEQVHEPGKKELFRFLENDPDQIIEQSQSAVEQG